MKFTNDDRERWGCTCGLGSEKLYEPHSPSCKIGLLMTQETDPNGIEQHSPGAKMDGTKPDMWYLRGFPRALRAVCLIAMYGAGKYTEDGWKHVPHGQRRYFSACMRHQLPLDGLYDCAKDGSQLLHDAHAAWNALATLEKLLTEKPSLLDDMQQELAKRSQDDS
jgi:hypothetical protein